MDIDSEMLNNNNNNYNDKGTDGNVDKKYQ